ncbi:hypothetical protein [Comamonas sp. JC664]|uniref:hypothetical protein n=1 Tax=Comamonas sp. JC664 TaxID=2801917 RepID=UPI0036120428
MRATDAKGAYATQSFGVYVQLPTNNPPQISSKPARAGPGRALSIPGYGDRPTQKRPADICAGQGPCGHGHIGQRPADLERPVLGSHAVEIKVQDSRGAYVVQSYTLQIAANREPVITSAPVPTAAIAAPYAYQVVATDPDGDFLTYRMSGARPA